MNYISEHGDVQGFLEPAERPNPEGRAIHDPAAASRCRKMTVVLLSQSGLTSGQCGELLNISGRQVRKIVDEVVDNLGVDPIEWPLRADPDLDPLVIRNRTLDRIHKCGFSVADIADFFGLSKSTIGRVIKPREKYKPILEPPKILEIVLDEPFPKF